MDTVGWILLTLLIGLIGGLISYRLKLPAGAMLGAMLFVIVFNLISDHAYLPRDSRTVLQIFSGVLLGSRIEKKDLQTLKTIVRPSLVLIVSMVILNLIFGFAMHRIGGLDLATSLFATAPGGMTDMALIADELGASMIQVSSLQLLRLLVIFATLPAIFLRLTRRRRQPIRTGQANLQNLAAPADKTPAVQDQAYPFQWRNLVLTILVATGGGLLLWMMKINAGAMIGSMLAVSLFNIRTGKATSPRLLRFAVQCAAGAFVGQTVNRDSLAILSQLLIPMVIMVAAVFIFTAITAFSMYRLTRLDPITCLIASAPGGLQEMSLLAEDLNADPAKVVVLQTVRLMSVIILFPTILTAVSQLGV